MHKIHYKPDNAWFGDCMPFVRDGVYYLFHQRDFRNPGPLPVCQPFGWDLVTTRDFVHYEDLGTAIPCGGKNEQDQFIFAGSVFWGEGKYHAFYTGYNREYPEQGKPSQVLMHASSQDLLHWEKSKKALALAPQPGYDDTDWRDPFVLWDTENQEYLLILGARLSGNKHQLTGRTVYFTSKNLEDWVFHGDFWAPGLFTMHEMPDLFKMGNWWYLLTTEYSDRCKTIYRMSKSLHGPWIAPADDAFDGRAYYAARTASCGEQRVLFGWVPTRETQNDKSDFIWGGAYLAHEIVQRDDGSLGVKIPDSVWNAFHNRKPLPSLVLNAASERTEQVLVENSSDVFSFEADFSFSAETRSLGFSLFRNSATGTQYQFTLLVPENRMIFEKSPNWPYPALNNMGLERPVILDEEKTYHIRLLVDGSIATLYLNDTALTSRMYDKHGSSLGVFASNGTVVLKNMSFSDSFVK